VSDFRSSSATATLPPRSAPPSSAPPPRGNPVLSVLIWGAIAALGAFAFGLLALHRGETINAAWLVIAAVCTYTIGYRFYSKFIAYKVFALDDRRATPAERKNDGVDYVPTNKWVLYGHHFAAIAGAGPLIGPVLAAQFGYLPGILWLVIGVVMAGAVQDFVIMMASMRRDGKSLGKMARDEINPVAGFTAMLAILAIMIILLAVLCLICVNALRGSPWGLFTIACTMPIAVFMGLWMFHFRKGAVLEASIIGLVLVLAATVGGRYVAEHPTLGPLFTVSGVGLTWWMIAYGFLASVLPINVLLAPRDYLSSFLKIGTIALLGVTILISMPDIRMPAVTQFIDGTGPIFAGKLFPFAFITIACGAISGFHALVSSGTTPKMLERESHSRMMGYGGMLTESFVGIMALIAACVLDPGVYFAINAPAGVLGTTLESASQTIAGWGFTVTPEQMNALAASMGETTLLSRTGGAPSLAVGMATVLSGVFGGGAMIAIWYHFAIMFEALFILTTIDAGTRVGRFMVQEVMGHIWKPLGRTNWLPSSAIASGIVVAAWGYFLYQGVTDPLGGINSLWPLFGIANQLLATVALCVGTTVIIQMGKARYAWVTLLPMAWLSSVTFTAGYLKVFSPEPKLGFLAHGRMITDTLAQGALPAGAASVEVAQRLLFNDRLDAVVTLIFMTVTVAVLASSAWEWFQILSGRKAAKSTESPYVPSALPQPAM
jgi:carbon starvation protein